jgi:glycogen synthase
MMVGVSRGNVEELMTEEEGKGLAGVIREKYEKGQVGAVYNAVSTEEFDLSSIEELTEVIDKSKDIRFERIKYGDSDDQAWEKFKKNRIALRERIKLLQERLEDLARAKSEKEVEKYTTSKDIEVVRAAKAKLVAIREGKDEEYVDPRIYGQLDDKLNDLWLVWVSRLVVQKGGYILFRKLPENKELGIGKGDRLIDVLMRIRGQNGEKVKLVVLGTAGDEEGVQEERLLQEAAQKYTGQIVFLNMFSTRLSKQMRATLGLFYMLSETEPGGIANLEALEMWLLVIVTYVGGLKDFVTLAYKGSIRENLLVVPAFRYQDQPTEERTAQEIVKRVIKLMQLWSSCLMYWVKEARELSKKARSWRECVQDYEELYKKAKSLVYKVA